MKLIRKALPFLLALLLLCSGCAHGEAQPRLRATASTYPVYVLACAVSAGIPGISVSRLQTGQVSCLHDYTLTVSDMRSLSLSQLVLLNGAGLEEFLESALAQVSAAIADCSAGISLLEGDGHDHGHTEHDTHDEQAEHNAHSHQHDPHIWMDPRCAGQMAENIAAAFALADPDYADLYTANAAAVSAALNSAHAAWAQQLSSLSCPYLITFHDGFSYFARAFGLDLLFSLEEEEGATASARDIRAAALLVDEYALPAVFTERNGSGAAAQAVSGETGCGVSSLSMLMDGPDAPQGASASEILTQLYLSPMDENIKTLLEVLQ